MHSQQPSGLLDTLHQWQLSTVPVAAAIILFHAIGIPAMQAQEHDRATALPINPVIPVLPSLNTPGLDGGEHGSMTPLQANMPEVRNVAPLPPNLAVSPERQAAVMAKARAEQHHFHSQAGGARAIHPSLGLDLSYSQTGMSIRPRGADDLVKPALNWSTQFSLAAIAIDAEELEAPEEATPVVVSDERASRMVAQDATEWWINTESGPEHGFTIAASPHPAPQSLTVTLTLRSSLSISQEEGTIFCKDENERVRLSYGELHVHDANGRALPSRMTLQPQGADWSLALEAELAEAVFPITVDPVVGTQQEETLASDGAAGDEFGFASDGIGDVMAVSSPGKGSGKVYLFHQDHPTPDAWDEKTSVVIPVSETPLSGDRFGQSIALFQDEDAGKTYLAVGAPQHDGTGSVFIYERNQGGTDNWGFVQTLQDVDLASGDQFGTAVDGLGNTLAVGAPSHDATEVTNNGAGAVFLHEVSGGTFSRIQKVTTPPVHTPVSTDEFGAAVALGGDHMIIGAPGENSANGGAYLFQRGSPYAPLFRLDTDKSENGARFGAVVAIAITGLLLAIGMPFDDNTFGPILVDAGAVFIFAVLPTLLAWGFLTAIFGNEAGAFFGAALALNYFFDLVVGATGATSTVSAVGGAVFIYLFSQFLFFYDNGSKVVPSTFIDAGMALGTSIVLLGTVLFVLGAAYSLSMGAMFIFLLAATVLTYLLWQQLYWSQDEIDNQPEKTGKMADPDRDGLPNWLEFAMLLIPVLYTPLASLGTRAANGNYHFVIQQSLVSFGVLLLIQYSLLLNVWYLLGTGPLSNAFSIKTLHDGIQARQLQITVSSLLVLILFMRLIAQPT